ncbi:MAG: ubiquitin-like domain-containing protein [Chloroflexota bacterium]
MKINRVLALVFAFCLFACQPTTPPTVTIIDNDKVITLQTDERVPSALIAQAGITLAPADRVLSNGLPIALNQPITQLPITLQLRRAVNLTLITPQGQQRLQSSAFTVGEVLQEVKIQLQVSDKVDPPVDTSISNLPITIYYYPSRQLTVSVDGKSITIQSSARTVGEALAEAGIPLLGLDQAIPSEKEALPVDGQVKVVRVSESVLLAQKPIPFESELVASADVPLDQNQILQPGENGLTVQRIRIRYEDGNEISRLTENESVVRPPKKRVLGYGTKVEIKTATVDGVQIEYWRSVQMYATSYSPCRSGTSSCSYGTSSGIRLTKGIVALRYSWYLNMGGQQLYVPGYGYATVGDVCGGCVGKPWIDLGYDEDNYQQWSSWVTVYFLTPVPANILYALE